MHGIKKLSKAGSTLEMDSGHENKKIGLYPVSTTMFKDFMRCRLFHICM